jgi:hypothetical protein
MNTFQKDLAFTFIKAIILTIIVIGAIASLSSCGRVADGNRKVTNEWRATVLKTGRHLTVKNVDSLVVMAGDTVTVFLNDGNNARLSYYYISNTPETAADTMTMEMYIDGKDTIYEPFEAWNVVLERRIIK